MMMLIILAFLFLTVYLHQTARATKSHSLSEILFDLRRKVDAIEDTPIFEFKGVMETIISENDKLNIDSIVSRSHLARFVIKVTLLNNTLFCCSMSLILTQHMQITLIDVSDTVRTAA
jgi:hypothetical protein